MRGAILSNICPVLLVAGGLLALSVTPAVPQNTSRLRVSITDSGRTIPARCYLTDSARQSFYPPGVFKYEKNAERHFVTRGEFELDLPPAEYTLVVERGPEYRASTRRIELRAGERRQETVAIERWIDMNRRGWYSGDLHNHRDWREMPDLLLADDLNLAPTLTQWVWDDSLRSRAPGPETGPAVRSADATHVYSVFDTEIERLRSGPGAVDLVGLRSPVDFRGSLLAPTNDTFADVARAQGGYVDAEKIVWRDAAALVALGKVDFAGVVYNHFNRHGVETQTDEWGMIPKERPEYATPAGMPLWALDVYYRFLNCGFRVPASAGSASGVKASPLGYARVYVHLDRGFDYHEWFRALKAGRSFATNGPMLFLTVNGREPGAVIEAGDGKTARLVVEAEASSARDLDRVEIIWKGKVMKTERASGSSATLRARLEFEAGETGWVAARAFERPLEAARFAQSSPVYVRTQRAAGLSRDPATARALNAADRGIVETDIQFFLDWIDREIAYYKELPGFANEADRRAMLDFFARARAVYAGMIPTAFERLSIHE